MKRALRKRLPTLEDLRTNPGLRWLGPLIERPWLWRLDRRSVAMGLALGMFFGLTIPIGQGLFSGAAAVLLRANLPIAVFTTFISNPFTTPAILVAGYFTGNVILGEEAAPALFADDGRSWLEKITSMGEPLVIGLLVIATIAAILSYALVHLYWRVVVVRRYARRRASTRSS